ncbi:MAG: N-acetyltransferase [Micrococcales bacterium]|nr:N-acetyltransferase [Micrococcales bacterium]
MLEEEYNPPRQLPRHLRAASAPEPAFAYSIRSGTAADIPDMLEIYNHYVANSTVTFDEDPLTLREMRQRFAAAQKLGHPWLVAETPSHQVIGYAYVTPWRQRAAYRHTVEDSIYLRPASTGKGLGTALLGALVEASREAGIREIIAVIADRGAEGSIRIHERFGFQNIGHMGKVGYKFGRYLGTVLLQLSLKRARRG